MMMDYPARLALAKETCAAPLRPDSDLQKFKRGSRVRAVPRKTSYWGAMGVTHFDAIVEYSCAQKYGGNRWDEYSLICLDEQGNPSGSGAWFNEDQLTLLGSNTHEGEVLIQQAERIGLAD